MDNSYFHNNYELRWNANGDLDGYSSAVTDEYQHFDCYSDAELRQLLASRADTATGTIFYPRCAWFGQ